jgi:hypothetical protein
MVAQRDKNSIVMEHAHYHIYKDHSCSKVKVKQSVYKAWTGPYGSGRLRLPDF